jgi:catechol 2,3-dioxygenase-like lactoylglutathione lyase family enzyme
MERPIIDGQITFLYTLDLAASIEFYENILGLPLWVNQATCRIYRVTESAYVGICTSGTYEAQRVEEQPNVIFTLMTPDVDGWYTHLQAHGANIHRAPMTSERYRVYNLFVRDPSGYLIEIQRFLDVPHR